MEVYVPEETTGCRYHVWRLVTSPPFENFIMLLIVLNTLLLMMKVILGNSFLLFFRSFFYNLKCLILPVPWGASGVHRLAVRLQSRFHHSLHH